MATALFYRSAVLLLFSSLSLPSLAADSMNDKSEQAVVVHFNYGTTDLQPIFSLEDKLEKAIDAAGVGDFDGDEIAADGSDGYLYMYGPSADEVFNVIKPILEQSLFMKGAKVTKVYGQLGADVPRVEVVLAP